MKVKIITFGKKLFMNKSCGVKHWIYCRYYFVITTNSKKVMVQKPEIYAKNWHFWIAIKPLFILGPLKFWYHSIARACICNLLLILRLCSKNLIFSKRSNINEQKVFFTKKTIFYQKLVKTITQLINLVKTRILVKNTTRYHQK